MAETLDALLTHLGHHDDRQPARIVVWAHNSHVGDARATEVLARGQLTLGQLARENYVDESRLLGFGTYTGTVTAASEWGRIAERKVVQPGLPNSVEEPMHETDKSRSTCRCGWTIACRPSPWTMSGWDARSG